MRTLGVALVSVLLVGCGEASPPQDAGATQAPGAVANPSASIEDPEVRRVHERMMAAMAPDDGWERARYIEFDWIVRRSEDETLRRSHAWARWEGDVRVEQPSQDGTVVAVFNLADPEAGRVWLDRVPQEGERARSLLGGAHRSFINDSYWFLMPYKWTDPGVNLRYLGEETDDDGRTWEVVQLSFGDVGLTPENMYRAYVDPESGLMERWHFIRNAESEPAPSDWTGWTFYGPIQVATERLADGVPRIWFENIRVETAVPGGAFDPPTAN